MNFLYTFVSAFFVNYLVIWIISLLTTSKKRNLIALIIISIFNLANIILNALSLWDAYLAIASQNALNEYTSVLLNGVGNLFASIIAYLATLVLLLDGKKIFKSRRQKQYLNAVNKKSLMWPIIAIIVFLLLGVACLVYGIITSIHFTYDLLIATFGAYGMMVVFFGLAYYIFYINFTTDKRLVNTANENSNVINATILNKTKVDLSLLFILHLGNNKYYFKGNLDEIHTINYYLGQILNVYVLTDFGSINKENEKIIVKGIKVERIDENLLKEIKLQRIQPDERFLNIVSNFERYRTKTIFLNSAGQIEKIIER